MAGVTPGERGATVAEVMRRSFSCSVEESAAIGMIEPAPLSLSYARRSSHNPMLAGRCERELEYRSPQARQPQVNPDQCRPELLFQKTDRSFGPAAGHRPAEF